MSDLSKIKEEILQLAKAFGEEWALGMGGHEIAKRESALCTAIERITDQSTTNINRVEMQDAFIIREPRGGCAIERPDGSIVHLNQGDTFKVSVLLVATQPQNL